MNWKRDEWTGCYPSNWKGVIVPEAMSHPAKYSSKLIRRIYEHMKAEGWLKEGDMVLDPFGGIGLGGLDATRLGFNWVGNELELKFHRLGQGMDCPGFDKAYWRRYHGRGGKWNSLNICPDCGNLLNGGGVINEFFGLRERAIPTREPHRYHGNIETWEIKYPHVKGSARLLHGDSRFLLKVLQGLNPNGAVSSPPYSEARIGQESGQEHCGRGDQYGQSDGQLGAMKGDNFNGAISSPPYAETDLQYKKNGLKVDGKEHYERPYMDGQGDENYGATDGQLGGMKAEGFEAAISSPPFEERSADGGWQMLGKYAEQGKLTVKQVKGNGHKSYPSWDKDRDTSYGETDGQMGQMKSSPEGFSAAISSPPYTGNVQVEKNSTGINLEKQYEVYKASGGGQSFEGFKRTQETHSQGYGHSDGQLSDMSSNGFSAAISSPPFRHSEGGTPEPKPGGAIDAALYARHAAGNSAAEGYGGTDGQLANMEEGDFSAVVSSPPFVSTVLHDGGPAHQQGGALYSDYGGADGNLANMSGDGFEGVVSSPPFENQNNVSHSGMVQKWCEQNGRDSDAPSRVATVDGYGETEGNIGNNSGDDFWLAARTIVEQVYLALAPGAHAAWVVKGFVKDKKYVDFPDQWRQLCEAVGFVTVHEHRAMLVHSKGKQYNTDGDVIEKTVQSKSFFRRLAEKNGSPRVDFETVWCMVKPESGTK